MALCYLFFLWTDELGWNVGVRPNVVVSGCRPLSLDKPILIIFLVEDTPPALVGTGAGACICLTRMSAVGVPSLRLLISNSSPARGRSAAEILLSILLISIYCNLER